MPRPLKKVAGGSVAEELDALWPIVETDDASVCQDKLRARATHKAKAHKNNSNAPIPVRVEPGLTVLVRDISVDGLGRLVCTVDHKDIPEGANPFIFVNPPILGPGGMDADGNPIFVEDLEEALKQMVTDAVRFAWRR